MYIYIYRCILIYFILQIIKKKKKSIEILKKNIYIYIYIYLYIYLSIRLVNYNLIIKNYCYNINKYIIIFIDNYHLYSLLIFLYFQTILY